MSNNYETIRLETERLILDKGSVQDYLQVYEYDFTKLRGIDGEFEYKKQDLDQIRNWFSDGIDKYFEDCKSDHSFDWIIYLKDTNLPIGNIMADRENTEQGTVELTFNLHPSYWGNGYMPESITKVINFLFEFGYNGIVITYDEGNNKSKRVAEKLGFELNKFTKGVWKKNDKPIDQYEMIMYREYWLNNRHNQTK